MKNRKKDIMQFLIWARNGIAFCTTWFLILILAYCHISNKQEIPTSILTKMLLLIIGGVFIFSIFFTRCFIRNWSFIKRLTSFMITVSVYECVGFYWIGIFNGTGTIIQWIAFIGIVCGLYFCCIAIYQRHSQKQGEIYTQALQKYQQERSAVSEKQRGTSVSTTNVKGR